MCDVYSFGVILLELFFENYFQVIHSKQKDSWLLPTSK